MFSGRKCGNYGGRMSSYDSMKAKLEPIGLYLLETGSNVCNELSSYAEGLDTLFETLDTMTKEYFIDTAESYGITARERFVGKEKSEYTQLQRKEMLKLQEQNMGNKCNTEAFSDILRSLGLSDFEFTERFSSNSLIINVNDVIPTEMQKLVTDRVEAEFPAHLNIIINFAV